MDDSQRVTLMLETAIDLAMDGFDLGIVLREFAKVRQFLTLGDLVTRTRCARRLSRPK
jgi:hypothetical protein